MDNCKHIITIHSRAEIEISGVSDVGEYNSEEMEVQSLEGRIYITGENFNITKFDSESGVLRFTGKIDSLCYTNNNAITSKGFLSKIFK